MLTIITPSYNQVQFIAQAIESVRAQGMRPVQHLVMDGGSFDGTADYLDSLGDAVEYDSGPDGGQANAVNKGLARAEGEIIGWLNSDDYYYPGAFAAVLDIFQAHPRVDVVYGDADFVDPQGLHIVDYPVRTWSMTALARTCFLCQPAVFFRKSVYERWGGLDERYYLNLDYDYWIKLACAGATFYYLPQKLAASRMQPANKTTLSNEVAYQREGLDMRQRRLGYVPAEPIHFFADAVEREACPTRVRHIDVIKRSAAEYRRYNGALGCRFFLWYAWAALFRTGLMRSGEHRRRRVTAHAISNWRTEHAPEKST